MEIKISENKKQLWEYFSVIQDPRVERTRQHKLVDIIFIAICGTICGADDWVEIAEFGEAKKEWLKRFLELPNGIPSHDTFGRVFSMIDPKEFNRCFMEMISDMAEVIKGENISIDGKTIRHSYEPGKSPIHMVSAWAGQNQMVLAQIKTEEKSNEITAIPKLLQLLEIHGCIVTIDAMGCQKEIAGSILEKKADYVLALKGNQGNLHEDVTLFLENAKKTNFKEVKHKHISTLDKGHGRIEPRKYWITDEVDWLNERHQWPGLRSIGMVESTRQIKNKITTETRYYISSLPANVTRFSNAVRGHWGIENSLHWCLDIAFREDDSRVRKDHSPENLAVLRHIAINLLKNEKTSKVGIKAKRGKAGWNNAYLEKVLANAFS